MALTCDHCLKGDYWRCRDPNCARRLAAKPDETRPRRKVPSQKRSTHKSSNQTQVVQKTSHGILTKHMETAILAARSEGASDWLLGIRLQGRQAPDLTSLGESGKLHRP